MLNQNYTFVEFGAGKGELSFVLHNYLYQSKKVKLDEKEEKEEKKEINDEEGYGKFVLIDRSNFRRKTDHKLKEENKKRTLNEEEEDDQDNNNVIRIKIDISHLDFGKVESVKNQKCVCISKHLCGVATDLTLRCINQKMENNSSFPGIFIALCCHHLCTWGSYINQKYFKEMGFDKEEFEFLSKMSSWGTCGFKTDDDTFHLNKNEKESLGRKCKRLIDMGRVLYLKENGYSKVYLIHYIPVEFSLENCLLIGIKN